MPRIPVTPEEREELLAAYALGSLSAPDAAEVEDLVSHDAQAAADLAAYHEVVDLIALSAPMRRADPSVRARVLEMAHREARERPRRVRARAPAVLRYLPAAAMVGAVVILAGWVISLQATLADLRSDFATLTSIVESDAKQIEALVQSSDEMSDVRSVSLSKALEDQQVIAAVQTDPDVITTTLEATSNGHNATGRYLWSASAGAGVVVAHNLPPLPIGAAYRVWIEDRFSRLVAGTIIETDERGNAQVLIRTEGDEEPVRLYIVATTDYESETVEGPVVLQGTLHRPAAAQR